MLFSNKHFHFGINILFFLVRSDNYHFEELEKGKNKYFSPALLFKCFWKKAHRVSTKKKKVLRMYNLIIIFWLIGFVGFFPHQMLALPRVVLNSHSPSSNARLMIPSSEFWLEVLKCSPSLNFQLVTVTRGHSHTFRLLCMLSQSGLLRSRWTVRRTYFRR